MPPNISEMRMFAAVADSFWAVSPLSGDEPLRISMDRAKAQPLPRNCLCSSGHYCQLRCASRVWIYCPNRSGSRGVTSKIFLTSCTTASLA